MNKYWKFQGKIITLSSFLSAPKKVYNLRTLGPHRTFAKKWWALMVGAESVNQNHPSRLRVNVVKTRVYVTLENKSWLEPYSGPTFSFVKPQVEFLVFYS
jgi:hypothetical protein